MTEETPSYEQPWPAWEPLWLCDYSVESMCKTLGGMEDQGGPRLSRRKLRLFTAACLRRIQRVFKDQRNRRFIDTVEEHADGLITYEENSRRLGQLADPPNADAPTNPDDPNYPCEDNPVECACTAMVFAVGERMIGYDAYTAAAWAALAADNQEEEGAAQVSLLRCIFGNPFRPVALNPAWRTPTVTALATAAYDERELPAGTLDPERLAVLADALEDAGCDKADILSHLRGPGPHVRGCFVLDLLLGRK